MRADTESDFADMITPPSNLSDLSIDALVERIKINAVGFWDSHRFLIYFLIISIFCDTLSTVHFMSYLGAHAELNPSVRLLSMLCGVVAGPFLGGILKAITCILVSIYYRRHAPSIFSITSAIYFWAAWYNIWGVMH